MNTIRLVLSVLLVSPVAVAQAAVAAGLPVHTALPIVFTETVSAAHAHVGDAVSAKTTQKILLANGITIAAGARVKGHVVAANAFAYDATPYAKQPAGQLVIQFDELRTSSVTLPLRVAVRAMASPIATNDAADPKSTDIDSLATTTQIGGDQLVPSSSEVRNREGDVVAYNRRDGVFAHLIPNGPCDGSDNEVSVSNFSASACGLYGFGAVTLSASSPALTLSSTHTSPQVWKHTTALLEVLPETTR